MNFTEKIVGTIQDPKNTMKKISEQPMIEEAVAILGIYAVLTALASYIQTSKMTYVYEGFDNMPPSMQSIATVSALVAGLVSPFIIWLIGTGIIHLISIGLGGEGKFYPQMMTVVGYSMIPVIFAGIATLALFSMMEPMTITISRTNPMALKELTNPYITASNIFGLVMQAWVSLILFFGIQDAHRLTPSKSAVVAGIPLAISIISFIWIRGIL